MEPPRRRACVLTFASVKYDSRVRRIVRLLAAAGHDVMLLSADAAPPEDLAVSRHQALPSLGTTRAGVMLQILAALPARLLPAAAPWLQRLLPPSAAAVPAIIRFHPHVIHANDWSTLPAAVAAAPKIGAALLYDSHEMAVSEHAHIGWWRLLMKPHVATVEGRLIGKADHITTVSEGLRQELKALYGHSASSITVIRNLPEACAAPRSLGSGPLELVYAGLIAPERRIDIMIDALALARRPWRLTIMGFGQSAHVAALKALAETRSVADRITWEDAVRPEALVETLARADIGLFLSDGATAQQRAALPNKIFEYAAAGLGLIAGGSAEVEKLISAHGHGRFVPEASPRALADVLDAIEPDLISTWKQHASRLSAEQNWTTEGARLLAVYAALNADLTRSTM